MQCILCLKAWEVLRFDTDLVDISYSSSDCKEAFSLGKNLCLDVCTCVCVANNYCILFSSGKCMWLYVCICIHVCFYVCASLSLSLFFSLSHTQYILSVHFIIFVDIVYIFKIKWFSSINCYFHSAHKSDYIL